MRKNLLKRQSFWCNYRWTLKKVKNARRIITHYSICEQREREREEAGWQMEMPTGRKQCWNTATFIHTNLFGYSSSLAFHIVLLWCRKVVVAAAAACPHCCHALSNSEKQQQQQPHEKKLNKSAYWVKNRIMQQKKCRWMYNRYDKFRKSTVKNVGKFPWRLISNEIFYDTSFLLERSTKFFCFFLSRRVLCYHEFCDDAFCRQFVVVSFFCLIFFE